MDDKHNEDSDDDLSESPPPEGEQFGRARLPRSRFPSAAYHRAARQEPRPPNVTQLEFFHSVPA
jgi:hypothetical protein